MTTRPTQKEFDKLRLMISRLNEQHQPAVDALTNGFACTYFGLLLRKAA